MSQTIDQKLIFPITENKLPFADSKVFFPGLNSLRFFAAALVIIGHTEQQKKFFGLKNHPDLLPHEVGSLAVTFFFVLSGFLITFLLFKEKEKTGTVAIKKFYFRRILRIWPVYYLIVFLAFAVLPNIDAFYITGYSDSVKKSFPQNLILYLVFAPNIAHISQLGIVYASQLWSVGVEEQFYLVWPFLIKITQHFLSILLAVVIIFFLLRNAAAFLSHQLPSYSLRVVMQELNEFFNMTRIGSMAIGGLGAYYVYNGKVLLKSFFINQGTEVITVLTIIILCYYSVFIPYLNIEVYSLLFCLLILNISCNPKSVFRLENAFWAKLGDISYGIYMYHLIAIGIILFLMKQFKMQSFDLYENLVLHVTAQLLTYSIAYLSFQYFEKPFLKLKKKHVIIRSGT